MYVALIDAFRQELDVAIMQGFVGIDKFVFKIFVDDSDDVDPVVLNGAKQTSNNLRQIQVLDVLDEELAAPLGIVQHDCMEVLVDELDP